MTELSYQHLSDSFVTRREHHDEVRAQAERMATLEIQQAKLSESLSRLPVQLDRLEQKIDRAREAPASTDQWATLMHRFMDGTPSRGSANLSVLMVILIGFAVVGAGALGFVLRGAVE